MVSIIENWAIIIGVVVGISPVEPEFRFEDLTIEIERIENYETYPMLLIQKPGDRVAVRVLSTQLRGCADPNGAKVSIRVRRGTDPQRLFAHPDWSVETAAH